MASVTILLGGKKGESQVVFVNFVDVIAPTEFVRSHRKSCEKHTSN